MVDKGTKALAHCGCVPGPAWGRNWFCFVFCLIFVFNISRAVPIYKRK